MGQSVYTIGTRTFTAGEDLLPNRRVGIKSGTTTTPPEVEYKDAGVAALGMTMDSADSGDAIAVRLFTDNGTMLGVAADTFSLGATLYGAADGKISDTSSGSAIGIALEACTTAGDIVEWAVFPVVSTTAATVTIADAGEFTTQTTVEAAEQEIYQHILSTQAFIPISLMSLREASSFDVGAITANGGVLASDTTPILEAINDATDGCQRLVWAASNNDQVIFQTPLPPDLDTSADVVLHLRTASGGTTDAVGFTVDSFFNEGDTKVVDTSQTNQTTSWAEKTATIAATDVPSGAQTLTVGLTPVAHTTDTLNLSAVWIEYTRKILTT